MKVQEIFVKSVLSPSKFYDWPSKFSRIVSYVVLILRRSYDGRFSPAVARTGENIRVPEYQNENIRISDYQIIRQASEQMFEGKMFLLFSFSSDFLIF